MIRNPFFCPSTVNQMKGSSSPSCMLLSSIPGSFSPNHLPASCFMTDSIDDEESMSDLEDLMEDITFFEDDRHVHFDADSFHKSNGRLSPTNSSETETTTTLSWEESSLGSIPRVIDTEEVHHSPPEYRQRRTPKASNTKKPTRRTSIEEKKQRKRELEEKLGALLHHHEDHHDSHPQQPVKKNKPFVRPDLIPAPLSNQSLILAPSPLSPRLQPKTVCPRSLCQSNKAWVSPNSLSSPASI